jgi:hypothetical protein
VHQNRIFHIIVDAIGTIDDLIEKTKKSSQILKYDFPHLLIPEIIFINPFSRLSISAFKYISLFILSMMYASVEYFFRFSKKYSTADSWIDQ